MWSVLSSPVGFMETSVLLSDRDTCPNSSLSLLASNDFHSSLSHLHGVRRLGPCNCYPAAALLLCLFHDFISDIPQLDPDAPPPSFLVCGLVYTVVMANTSIIPVSLPSPAGTTGSYAMPSVIPSLLCGSRLYFSQSYCLCS